VICRVSKIRAPCNSKPVKIRLHPRFLVTSLRSGARLLLGSPSEIGSSAGEAEILRHRALACAPKATPERNRPLPLPPSFHRIDRSIHSPKTDRRGRRNGQQRGAREYVPCQAIRPVQGIVSLSRNSGKHRKRRRRSRRSRPNRAESLKLRLKARTGFFWSPLLGTGTRRASRQRRLSRAASNAGVIHFIWSRCPCGESAGRIRHLPSLTGRPGRSYSQRSRVYESYRRHRPSTIRVSSASLLRKAADDWAVALPH